MMTDTVIRNKGMKMLLESLGKVEAERFIMIIQRDSFDYTKWQEDLFEDMTIEEISANAARYRTDKINCRLEILYDSTTNKTHKKV